MTMDVDVLKPSKRSWLDNIEAIDNKIPDITMLFFYGNPVVYWTFCCFVLVYL